MHELKKGEGGTLTHKLLISVPFRPPSRFPCHCCQTGFWWLVVRERTAVRGVSSTSAAPMQVTKCICYIQTCTHKLTPQTAKQQATHVLKAPPKPLPHMLVSSPYTVHG